jgi:SAM-dependent methyltransferase
MNFFKLGAAGALNMGKESSRVFSTLFHRPTKYLASQKRNQPGGEITLTDEHLHNIYDRLYDPTRQEPKPADGRTDGSTNLDRFFGKPLDWMDCPICGQPTHPVFQKYDYWIHECEVCHHRCTNLSTSPQHVVAHYGDDYFTGGGAGYCDYFSEADLITAHGKQYGELLENHTTPGKMLDVGAAAGFVLRGFSQCGWNGVGLEPNKTVANYGQLELGLDIRVGALEKFQTDEKFDLVSMIQVLPHFYDLKLALGMATKLTKPSGYWLIETWNKDSWLARLMGQDWHEYSPPSVLHFFSPDTLGSLVSQFGFTEVARGRPSKKLNGGHAKSLIQYKLRSSAIGSPFAGLLNVVPDHLAIPYPSYDLFWALYKKDS